MTADDLTAAKIKSRPAKAKSAGDRQNQVAENHLALAKVKQAGTYVELGLDPFDARQSQAASELRTILNPSLLARFTLAEIARAAEIHPNHLNNLRAGRRCASRSTIGRLKLAISRLNMRQTGGAPLEASVYRVLLAAASMALGLDAAEVQTSDPRAKQAASKSWRDASMARWLAQYLLNTGLGLRQAEVARAAGVTKQAVSLAMREIELKRDDATFDAIVRRLEDCMGTAA